MTRQAANEPIKVGFVLLSNSRHPIASTRITALNMFSFLRAAHFAPHIVFEPPRATETPEVSGLAPSLMAEGFRIVFFQKVHGPSVEALARELSDAGISTVYSVCDLVKTTMAEATRVTITVTDYLRSLYPLELQPKIRVVHDGIERPDVCKTTWRADRGSHRNPLRAVLVTSEPLHELPLIGELPEWLEVEIVGPYAPAGERLRRVREARWKLTTRNGWRERLAYLRFLANRRIRRVAWDPVGVYERMKQADIGIIPIDTSPGPEPGENSPRWKVKSENRLTMKMAVGLPVIATPIPAYESVMEHGQSGFFARSRGDWTEYLDALRDPVYRRTIGERARESVLARFSKEAQADRLIAILERMTQSDASSPGSKHIDQGRSQV